MLIRMRNIPPYIVDTVSQLPPNDVTVNEASLAVAGIIILS